VIFAKGVEISGREGNHAALRLEAIQLAKLIFNRSMMKCNCECKAKYNENIPVLISCGWMRVLGNASYIRAEICMVFLCFHISVCMFAFVFSWILNLMWLNSTIP